MNPSFTIDEIAEHFQVSSATVQAWIKSGEMKAVNVSRARGSKKPRLRITQEFLERFELARSESLEPPKMPRFRRNRTLKQFI